MLHKGSTREKFLQKQQAQRAQQYALGQAKHAASQFVGPRNKGKGENFLQNAGKYGHRDDHAQKDEHIGGNDPPRRINNEGELRGKQGMVVVRGPKTAQQ